MSLFPTLRSMSHGLPYGTPLQSQIKNCLRYRSVSIWSGFCLVAQRQPVRCLVTSKLGLLRMQAEIGPFDLDFLAHLMQSRAHTLADSVTQRFAPRGAIGGRVAARVMNLELVLLLYVWEVGSDDGGLVLVVTAVEDVVDSVEDPLGAAHRAELVEHQYFGVEDRLQDFHLCRLHLRVVRVLDGLQQLTIVAEQAADALLAN